MEAQDLVNKMGEAGLHIGVRRFLVHPKMRGFIFTYKDDLALINLAKSAENWTKTMEYLKELVFAGKPVLFLGTQPIARAAVASFGEEVGVPYMTKRWLGGTLTNFATFKERLNRLKDLEMKIASPDFEKYTKKEQGQMQEEAKEIREKFDGLVRLNDLPKALFVFCARRHRTAILEAKKTGIPVIGVLGLDDNPDEAKHFIPINDNSSPAVSLVLDEVREIYRQRSNVKVATQTEKLEAPQAVQKK